MSAQRLSPGATSRTIRGIGVRVDLATLSTPTRCNTRFAEPPYQLLLLSAESARTLPSLLLGFVQHWKLVGVAQLWELVARVPTTAAQTRVALILGGA